MMIAGQMEKLSERVFPELPGNNMLSVSLLCLSILLTLLPSLLIHAIWQCSNGNPLLPQKQGCSRRPALCSISSSHTHLKNVHILPQPRSTCCVSLIRAHSHINNSIQYPDCCAGSMCVDGIQMEDGQAKTPTSSPQQQDKLP